jgi:HK97 family phage portal protein
MFGFGKTSALKREIEQLELEQKAAALRAGIQASSTSTATYPLSDPLAYEKLFGPNLGGVSPDAALKHSAFYRCIFLIAGSIAMLTFKVYKVQPDGHRVLDTSSPAAKLISVRPNGRMSPTMLWRNVVSDMLMNGNGIVWIERARSGEPLGLYPIPWNRTGIRMQWIEGELVQVYTLSLDDGRMIVAHQDDVLHIPGSMVWEIYRAMSPLTAYAMSVGIALSADAFAKAYFDNGSTPDSVVSYPAGTNVGKAGMTGKDEIREYVKSRFGGTRRFSGPLVLDNGGKMELLQINAADAQLLDSRKFSVSDIGRIFGVPAHMLNETDKATSFGKGLEEMTQSFLDFTLGPHLQAIEDEVNYKLVRQSTKVAEFDREDFVRGDMKSRMEALQKGLGGAQGPGIMSQNEARRKVNLGPSKDPKADTLVSWPPVGGVGDAHRETQADPTEDPDRQEG